MIELRYDGKMVCFMAVIYSAVMGLVFSPMGSLATAGVPFRISVGALAEASAGISAGGISTEAAAGRVLAEAAVGGASAEAAVGGASAEAAVGRASAEAAVGGPAEAAVGGLQQRLQPASRLTHLQPARSWPGLQREYWMQAWIRLR